jgi:hypothetical protein
MIQNREVLIEELRGIIVREISRINDIYRRGPSLYFYRRIIQLRREHPRVSDFIASDYCIEIAYATLVSWDMNSRGAKMKDFELFRANLRANRRVFEELEELSRGFSYQNARDVLECLSRVYDSTELMVSGGKLVACSKCLHFIFPSVCMPMDRRNTLMKIYGHTNESKNKFMELVHLSYDVLAGIQERTLYLDEEWNAFETKLVDNAILLKAPNQAL